MHSFYETITSSVVHTRHITNSFTLPGIPLDWHAQIVTQVLERSLHEV